MITFFVFSAMSNSHSKDQFIEKIVNIVEGVTTNAMKVKRKSNGEKVKRDALNCELLSLLELQRKYATMVRKFKIACSQKRNIYLNEF